MLLDQYSNQLSTENSAVVPIVDQFSSELLRFGKKLDGIIHGVNKYPEEVILHIYAAFFYLYSKTEENHRQASVHLDQASRLIDRTNEREKSLFAVAWHWVHHLLADALKDIERHCFKWPKDLTAIKIAEFLFFCKGQKYESKRFLRLTTQCYREHSENANFLAIHSFALELSGKYEESQQMAEKALKLNEENPWAQHSLAHLYLNKGMIEQGIERLERYSKQWSQFHPMIASHNLWHLALLYLENLDFEKVEEVYKRADWVHQLQSVAQEIDATSLLWRLDLEGKENLELWKQLAEKIGDHANYADIPFISVQLCYALKKGGRTKELKSALEKIDKIGHEQVKEDRYVWREVGLPLLHATLAFADGDYAQASHLFEPLIDHIGCIGGSDVQIALFYQTYLKSLIGAHRYADAESLLHQMTQGRNLSKLERKWLAECQSESAHFKKAI